MKTGKKKKQGRSLMFSSQLFVYIFSASFLLLVVGLLVLYRVSSNAAADLRKTISRELCTSALCNEAFSAVRKWMETQLFGGKKIISVDSGGRICYNKLQI